MNWPFRWRLAPPKRAWPRRAGRGAGLGAVTLAGVLLGVLAGGSTHEDIGPFRAQLAITPSLSGDTSVEIPPLGSLQLDSHDGPVHLTVRLDSLDEARTRAVVSGDGNLSRVGQDAVTQISHGVRRLAMQVAGAGVLGAMGLSALVYRRRREVALAGCISLLILASSGAAAQLTFRPKAIQEPRYEGLLTNAPAVVGDARRIADRYEEYRAQLQRLLANVSRLYGTISSLPVYEPDNRSIKVLHISDMHLNPAAWSVVQTIVSQFNIDVVVDTGDLVDWGSEPEASYVAAIASLRVPYVYIRGNHDSVVTAAAVARQPNAKVLDRSIVTVDGLTFAGSGDPRFTPDKSTVQGDEAGNRSVVDSGEQLAEKIKSSQTKVDIALVHDPLAAGPIAGTCPLVLAGHTHSRAIRRLDPPDGQPVKGERTLLMVEGSTGGAGLRGLEQKDPLPLALSILYFDQDHKIQAYDDIRVGGTGLTEVSLTRKLVAPDDKAPASPSPSPTEPQPSGPQPSGPQPSARDGSPARSTS